MTRNSTTPSLRPIASCPARGLEEGYGSTWLSCPFFYALGNGISARVLILWCGKPCHGELISYFLFFIFFLISWCLSFRLTPTFPGNVSRISVGPKRKVESLSFFGSFIHSFIHSLTFIRSLARS